MNSLPVTVHDSRSALGSAAAQDIADALVAAVAARGSARVVFAAAPSQQETLDALVQVDGVPWDRVDALHMDEYVGLPVGAPERFAVWLDRTLFGRLPFRSVHRIDPGSDPEAEAARYATVVADGPIDVVVLGIGENGHIAFNDPPVAAFDDPVLAKLVDLDDACREQQVADECFARFADVPKRAITLTVPALMSGARLVCVVKGERKAAAVRATFEEPVSTTWPSTILRTHPSCVVHLDRQLLPSCRSPHEHRAVGPLRFR
ncbi:6-phosphogluconolactonase [Curtobacterium flaccumfaciens]|nr:6-phosphogluconolactonase [Curtobacterium flaccumfaciens]